MPVVDGGVVLVEAYGENLRIWKPDGNRLSAHPHVVLTQVCQVHTCLCIPGGDK
jgi:hypothetical protein